MAKNVGQIYYRIPIIKPADQSNPVESILGYESNINSLSDSNIVEVYCKGPNHYFSKVGIQAPAGTRIIMNKNEDKVIMIGKTGIYELDEDINIDYMRFIKPIKYKLDETATNVAIEKGKQALMEAEKFKQDNIDTLDKNSSTYWEDYTRLQEQYFNLYNTALVQYKKGVNGIYVRDPDSTEDLLENIIIDFIYE